VHSEGFAQATNCLHKIPCNVRHIAAVSLLALSSVHALAADPTASLNKSFAEYTATGPVGNNNINTSTFYWMKEQAGTWMGQQVQSWLLIWDPERSEQVRGTVTFDADILHVLDSKAELQATAAFQKPGVTYNYSRSAVGLENWRSPATPRSATQHAVS
jgi:hypothetical protein